MVVGALTGIDLKEGRAVAWYLSIYLFEVRERSGMKYARGDDGSRAGRTGDGVGTDQGLKVDRLTGNVGDAKGALQLLTIVGIG